MKLYTFLLRKKIILCLSVLVFFFANTNAQQTEIYQNNTSIYNTALDLFDKAKYAAAQKQFLLYITKSKDLTYIINAKYYAGVCALELFNNDAVVILSSIISKYPENNKAFLAKYQLAKYYYRVKDNKKAVKLFGETNAKYLQDNELVEYYFLNGYCLFKVERFDDAKESFKNIINEKNKYYDAANYYYAYVSYKQNNFDEALIHFERVRHHKTFGPLSNVYVAQIYLSHKKYLDVIKYCDTMTNKDVATDVAGMLGQSYYFLNKFDKATPYLEKYNNDAPASHSSSDIYRLAYACKMSKQYEKAIEYYLKLSTAKDSFQQISYYQLGECYLQIDKKPNAGTAFEKAINLNGDEKINEQALFNAAKLNYDLGSTNNAITNLTKFIERFPASEHIDDAKSLISNLLLNTRNYKEAIRILESVKEPNEKDNTILQKIYFYRGEELFLNNDYKKAAEYFNKSIEKKIVDKKSVSLSNFWLGEIAYKESNYIKSIAYYQQAQLFDEFRKTKFFTLSFYNLAYAYLKTDDYKNAIEYFKKFVEKETQASNPEVYTDAVIRIADCYFATGSYEKSIDYYNLISSKNLNGSDYALYQKGLILGVLNRADEKISTLQLLIDKYPKSGLRDDAMFEKADMHLKLQNYNEALLEFNNIIKNYPNSFYVRKSMLNNGLVLFNQAKDEDAKEIIKQLAIKFSGTDESRQGIHLVKNIFINKGDVDGFNDWLKDIPNISYTASSQDSLTYESAFNSYKNKEYSKASKGFANYINRFAGGYFTLKANFFKAESDYILKLYDEALIGYEFTANSIRSDYSERATRQSAILYFGKKDYENAYSFYSILERIAGNKENLSIALIGQMRCAGLLKKQDTVATISFRYILSGIATKDGLIEARINTARFYMNRNVTDSALTDFQYLLKEAKTNVLAAESKYNIALIRFSKKDFKNSQKAIMELSEDFSAYEYWVANGFILLADIYTSQKDFFQAKATLQSVIDEYQGEDLKSIAIEKLKAIEALEPTKKDANKNKVQQVEEEE